MNGQPDRAPSQRDAASERALFQDKLVTVTNARAIVGHTTYSMANITSVREFVEPRPAAVAVLGVCVALMGASCVGLSGSIGGFELFVGAVLLLIYFFVLQPTYWVRIGTAGAETNAISSKDAKWTRTVVTAINDAIVTRG